MREDREYKDLPQIIDVEVEPDIDFELREPEEGIKMDKVYEDTYVNMQQVDEEEPMIDVESIDETITFEDYERDTEKIESEKEKPDTSFSTFKAGQKAGEKKWRKKVCGKFKNIIIFILACIVGIPLLGFGGFFGVAGVGMAILFCGMAFGMGVLGLGVSAFVATAEIAGLGGIMFSLSLVGIGAGGLGLLLILAILIGIKHVVVRCYKYMKNKFTQEVA